MKTKNYLLLELFSVVLALGFASCSDDDDDGNGGDVKVPNYVAYVLNSGVGDNGAILSYYDFAKKNMTQNIFEKVNKVGLGDLGQSVITYGTKIYVSVQNSGRVYVLDKDCKVSKVIAARGVPFSPKMMEAYNGKIYVGSYKENYVAMIDTTSMEIEKTIDVGLNPEYIKAVNGKIYVANSGGLNYMNGYNNTVSILNPDLTSETSINVAVNPLMLMTDKNNNLYLLSCGDYGYTYPLTLQQINTTTGEVNVLSEGHGSAMFINNNKIYLLDKRYQADGSVSSSFLYYDIESGEIVNESFIKDNTVIDDICSVNFEEGSGRIFVTAANGVNNGILYVFDADGKLQSKFDTGGAFPTGAGVCFVQK